MIGAPVTGSVRAVQGACRSDRSIVAGAAAVARLDARRAGEPSRSPVALEQVDQRERQVAAVGADAALDRRYRLRLGLHGRERGATDRCSVASRRAPITRSVSSVTTHSMPATALRSSRSGL